MSLLDKIRQEANSPTVKVPPRDDLLSPPLEAKEYISDVADAAGGEPLVAMGVSPLL